MRAEKRQVFVTPGSAISPLAVPGTASVDSFVVSDTSGNSPTTTDGEPSGGTSGVVTGTGRREPIAADSGTLTRTL